MYGICLNIFNMNRYISKSYTRGKNTIYRAGAAVVSTIISYREYSFVTQIVISGIRIVSCITERHVCTSTWPENKQVLAFTLFVRNSSYPVYDDCSMKKQPISTAVVLEFSELLNELQNHIETLACYLNVSILVIVIGSFFIFRSECFIIPTSLSYKL